MARIGRRQPAGSLVFTGKSLAHEDKTLDAELVSASATANNASVKIKGSAETLVGTVVANSAIAANKPRPPSVTGTVQTFDPVTGSFRPVDADRAFVQTVAFDATVIVGPVAITATAAGSPSVPYSGTMAGQVNSTATVYIPSSFTIRFSAETVTAAATVDTSTVSFLRMLQPGNAVAVATAYGQAAIKITFPSEHVSSAALVYDVPNQGLGLYPTLNSATATAYQPAFSVKARAGEVLAGVDTLIGIFSPRPVDASATAYGVQFYLDTVDWRTRDVEQEVRVKLVASESRTLTVGQRQLETKAR